jgi:hypothetical protein
MIVTVWEQADIVEMQFMLDEAYNHWAKNPASGAKEAEGRISLHFNTTHDRRAGSSLRVVQVDVYSYALGPGRLHSFDSTAAALEEVRKWYEEEMRSTVETEVHPALSPSADDSVPAIFSPGRVECFRCGEFIAAFSSEREKAKAAALLRAHSRQNHPVGN